MQKVITLEKTYNVAKHSSEKAFIYILKKEFENLDVEIKGINFTKERYAEVILEGEDEEIAKNILIKNYGTPRSISDLQEGDFIYGRFRETGEVKFGLFVDCGIKSTTQNIDALYPLFEMREQLAQGNKVPLMNMIRAYGFIDNLPMFFEVVKKQVIGSKVWVKLTVESLEWLNSALEEKKEALIICGTTRNQIKQALIRSNHAEDIEVMERIGLLEYRLICKRGTRADGLIPELGHHLGRAKIGAQVPSRVKKLLKKSD
jgi:hypothetical protein